MHEEIPTPHEGEKLPVIDRSRFKTIEAVKIGLKEGETMLYHGGLAPDTSIESIDLQRFGTQQNKRGRTYGGFYLADESSVAWAKRYAMQRNRVLHAFVISSDARILETDNMIDRLSAEEREEMSQSYDVVKGKDVMRKTQYVLLNKGVVKEIGVDIVDSQ